jgi:uncharacterized protein YrrD
MIEDINVEEENMPTVKDHLNKPVISTSGGKKLGKIKDLYFDPKVTKVTAVSLGASGILRRKKLMIDRAKVQTCGEDAWLVSRADVVVGPKNIVGSQEFVPSKELRGRKIMSEGGTEIATVDDVILDGQCNVKGFTLANFPASGPLSQRKAIALGAITSLGSKTSPMTTILAQAESTEIRT